MERNKRKATGFRLETVTCKSQIYAINFNKKTTQKIDYDLHAIHNSDGKCSVYCVQTNVCCVLCVYNVAFTAITNNQLIFFKFILEIFTRQIFNVFNVR